MKAKKELIIIKAAGMFKNKLIYFLKNEGFKKD